MLGKMIVAFAATAAQLLGAENTLAVVAFGVAKVGRLGLFEIDAAGKVTVNKSVGITRFVAELNAGGMVAGPGVLLVRMTLNGEQVGDTMSVTIDVGAVIPIQFEHTFESLTGGDEVQVEFILDAAGTATNGGTVLTTPSGTAAEWNAIPPARLTIYG